jgi:hypothetical protein
MPYHSSEYNTILSGEDISKDKLDQLSEMKTPVDLVEYYYHVYPEKHYYGYPEFAIKKLDEDKNRLNDLPDKEKRSRKDIYNWMLKQNFSIDYWLYVGW